MKKYALSILICIFFVLNLTSAKEKRKQWWSTAIESRLAQAEENRAEMEQALIETPTSQRDGMVFLIANMPLSDLQSLQADFLLDNLKWAYLAKETFSWAKQIPEELFLNYVLPYASIDEKRHPWRKDLYELCQPIVKECQSASEVAQKINATLFKQLKVKYSTRRSKPHQSPQETIESGMASCTGLSILLVDACRSVGIPARLVGTPSWTKVRGNHTWVEIWDNGWHFTGACEPDRRGLNHGWFVGRAAQALKDSKMNAIYAASFEKTGTKFPLVWNLTGSNVFAVNVTERYTAKKETKKETTLSHEQTQRIKEAVQDYFKASSEKQAKWKFDPLLDSWLASHEKQVRELVWKTYQSLPIHAEWKIEFESKKVKYQKHVSPYTVKTVGKRPKDGWPLFIAMHGGGGAPQQVNDSQWRIMQIYYRDQPSVPGYKYLALRAPNNIWNGFYDNYVPPLVTNLIRQFLLFGDVDSNKVYLMGYSHGGYGAFYIGPKIAHRFAAIHASAAAPTDGTISPETLRNTRFTFMIGEKDTAYGRLSRCKKFNEQIQKLKKENPKAFPVEMEFKKGYGHGGLPDREKIKGMYPHTRNPVPKHLTWKLTDSVNHNFFWLHVDNPKNGELVNAKVSDNALSLSGSENLTGSVYLDSRLVDLSKPLQLNHHGVKSKVKLTPSLQTLCDTLHEQGDPNLAFTCEFPLQSKNP